MVGDALDEAILGLTDEEADALLELTREEFYDELFRVWVEEVTDGEPEQAEGDGR